MANADRPRGFWPAYTLHGGPPHMRRVKKAGINIFKGDLVMNSTTLVMGGVRPLSGTTESVMGVAAEYSTGAGTTSAAHYINIYDDLDNTIFRAQADDAGVLGTSDTMLKYESVYTAASTCDGNETSIMEIDSSATSTNGPVYVIDKVDTVDNDYGEFAELYCKILSRQFLQTTTS